MKKRICFLVDSVFTIGGVQRVTAVIAKALAKEHDVTIVTFDDPDIRDTSLYGLHEADITYRFFRYPQVGAWKRFLCKAYSAVYRKCRLQSRFASDLYTHSSFPSELRDALANELRQGNYDVIIGEHAPLAVRLAAVKRLLPGTSCIGWIHNSFEALYSSKSLYIGADLKRHYVYQLRKLDATIVLSRHDAESYKAYDSKLSPTVIYNPLTLNPGAPSEGTSKRFLAVGRFSHLHKGFDLLIEAFHLFAQRNADWQLDIVGEGPEEELYRRLIKDYDLENRIHLHPFTNNIQSFYSQAQVYVLSSRWEGFGLVLIEAMAHGLPIVSSDLPTSKEIMGDFGIYFNNGNTEDLAAKLEEATKIDWQSRSEQAKVIAKNYALPPIIEHWKNILQL